MESDPTKFLGEVLFQGSTLKIYQSEYTNGRPAIYLVEDGMLFATVSVNLINESPRDGEFFVKTWLENEIIAPYVLEHTDLFEDTGKVAPTGRVQAPIWRFKKEGGGKEQ